MQKIENLNVRPISQLIYLKYNSTNSKTLNYKINKTIDKRLMIDYQLSKVQAKMLMTFEKNTILEAIGSNKECAFIGERSISDILNIIYSKLQFVNYSDDETSYTDEFDNLSLSELSLLNYVSDKLAKNYKKKANVLVERLKSGEIEVYDSLEETVNMRKFHQYLLEKSKIHFLNQPYFSTERQAMLQFKKEQGYIVTYNKKNLSQEVIEERNVIRNHQEVEKIYQRIAKRRSYNEIK